MHAHSLSVSDLRRDIRVCGQHARWARSWAQEGAAARAHRFGDGSQPSSRCAFCWTVAAPARRLRSLFEKGEVRVPPCVDREKRVSLEPGMSTPAMTEARWTIQSRGELTLSLLITSSAGGAMAPSKPEGASEGRRPLDVL